MAKKAKPNVGSAGDDLRREFEKRFFDYEDEIAKMQASFMADCKAVRDDQKDLMVEAKERGLQMKPFRAHLSVTKLERAAAKRRQKIVDALEPEDERIYRAYHADAEALLSGKPAQPSRADAERQADKDALDDFEAGATVQ